MTIARALQAPGGCPWDRAQTVSSLLPHLVEETWEVFESVRHRRPRHARDELGDVFYTVLFLILVAEREGWFRLRDLLVGIRRKMIRRHPHVFGPRPARTPDAAYARWQAVKRTEAQGSSRSNTLRPVLVDLWETLRQDPAAAARLSRWLAAQPRRRRASGRST